MTAGKPELSILVFSIPVLNPVCPFLECHLAPPSHNSPNTVKYDTSLRVIFTLPEGENEALLWTPLMPWQYPGRLDSFHPFWTQMETHTLSGMSGICLPGPDISAQKFRKVKPCSKF